MNRLFATLACLAVAGCVLTKPEEIGDVNSDMGDQATPPPQPEKLKIVNISYFDTGSCAAPSPTLSDPLNAQAIIGALVLARPGVLECYVDPKNRGTGNDTGAVVKATVSETGAAFEIAGTNLTPAGTACVEAALKRIPFKPLEKGLPAVSGSAGYQLGEAMPAVKLGVNEISDLTGAIRTGETGWCDCWSPLGSAPPPSLKAHLKVVPGKPTEVTFDPTTDPAATALATCLTPKVAAAAVTTGKNELSFSYPVLLVNSLAAQETADSVPELQLVQLDLIRAVRAADVAARLGVRINALQTYDGLVQKYKMKPTPGLIKGLKDSCATFVKSDDDWIAALMGQQEIDERSLAFASKQKGVNTRAEERARWEKVEERAKATVAASAAEVKSAQDVKVADQAVCPKERK